MANDKMISISVAARLIGHIVVARTLRRWVAAGRIEGRRVGGRWYVSRAAVLAIVS